jgi:hypothetical protein
MTNVMYAWHFLRDDRTAYHGVEGVIDVGKKYTVQGEIELCEWGFHGSIEALDALTYAPGSIVTWCDYGESLIIGGDQIVSNEKTILWMANAENVLYEFARWCALQVVHLWGAPPVVVDYLTTGDSRSVRAVQDILRATARVMPQGSRRFAARATLWTERISPQSSATSAARYAALNARCAAQQFKLNDQNKADWTAQNIKLTAMLNALGPGA